MSIALNTDNPTSRSPLQIPFSRLFVLEVDTISNLKGWVISGNSLLGGCKSRVFLAIASASLSVSRCSLPELGSPRKRLHWFKKLV